MAKNSEKQNIKSGQKQSSPAKRQVDERPFIERASHTVLIIALSAITWLFFSNALGNRFTDWDDKGYIITDNTIKDFSLHGLKEILTSPVMGHYHPITILFYTIEYHFAQLNPWLYHFDSIFCHTLTVILVYWFTYLLTRNKTAGLVTAILFSIHPMHVESVAWVAGRKDVLCTLFYFASCIAYLSFIRTAEVKKKWLRYAASFALYIAALLCKEVAVTLPVVLLIIDYYEKRQWKIAMLAEKIPYFILAVFFGILSIKISNAAGIIGVDKISYAFSERINLMCYALFIYLFKAILPIHLHNFYAYPEKVNGVLPYYYYAFPLLIAALAFITWHYFRKNKELVFGILFFLANIAILIKFVPVGDAMAAERYTYTSYFGLFFIAGTAMASWLKPNRNRVAIYLIATLYFIAIGYVSAERCNTWYDAATLWTDEMKNEPQAAISYNNLGFYYFEKRAADTQPAALKTDFDSAVLLMTKAVVLKPDYSNSIEGLGILYFMAQNIDSSMHYFGSFVRVKPCSESHYDYGLTLFSSNKKDSALIQYNASISLDSTNWKPLLNRGIVYQERGQYDEAIKDYSSGLKIDSTQGALYYNRSYCYYRKGDKKLASYNVQKAISKGYNDINKAYYNAVMGDSVKSY